MKLRCVDGDVSRVVAHGDDLRQRWGMMPGVLHGYRRPVDPGSHFRELVAYAKDDPGVVALYVFGSRGRSDGLSDERSDYDVGVVLVDRPEAVARFDRAWPFVHGGPVEVSRATLAELRHLGEYGSETEWTRPLYAQVDLVIDKTGEVASILADKRRVPVEAQSRLVRDGFGGYINATYRSLRYRMVGAVEGARLDAAESIPPLLTALFALDCRVRPFNKYLASELREQPLPIEESQPGRLLGRLLAVLDGSTDEQHALFRQVHAAAAAGGYGDAFEQWQPDVAWLRGEADYRE